MPSHGFMTRIRRRSMRSLVTHGTMTPPMSATTAVRNVPEAFVIDAAGTNETNMNISTERFGTFTLDEINDKLRVAGKVLVLKIEKSDRSLVDAYVARDVPPYEPEPQTFEGRKLSTTPKEGYYRSVPLAPDQGGPASEYWMEPESMYAERVRIAELKSLGDDYTCDSSPAFCKCPLHR
jgi:hypothetical protein